MRLEGHLRIDLYATAARRQRVDIRSSRPLRATQVLSGRTPYELPRQLPLLFSVCGVAQAAAGARALGQALSTPADPGVDAARDLLVQIETAREHLWRIAIDWRALLGEPADPRAVAPLQSMLREVPRHLFVDGDAFSLKARLRPGDVQVDEHAACVDKLLAAEVFGCAPAEWLRIDDPAGLKAWAADYESSAARLLRTVLARGWQALGATDGDFLPPLPAAELDRCLAADDSDRFIAAPVWLGETRETTPLARQYRQPLIGSLCRDYGNGLLTRLAARLVELARTPAAIRAAATTVRAQRAALDAPLPVVEPLPAGVGIAQVEAARGRLVHRAVVAGGGVERYQILAPTEWNFHPAGVAVRALAGLRDINVATLRRQAAMLVNAVDPCVGYDLEVHSDA